MEKVERNAPCPCGSGKKYKKCHGKSNVVAFSSEPYNAEIDILQDELLNFAIDHYKPELAEVFEAHPQPELIEDKELLNLYLLGLTIWIIFTKPLVNHQTIFELFYKKRQDKIRHHRVRKTFAAWSETTPRLYETISVANEWIYVRDVHSNEEYKVATLADYYFEEDLIFGMLVPFVGHYEFMEPSLEIGPEEVLLIELFSGKEPLELLENYPDYLATFFLAEELDSDMEWEHPMYGIVAELFISHLYEKDEEEDLIAVGVYLWKIFTMKEQPIIRKPNGYAAALEYILQKYVASDAVQSQKNLAEQYGTSVKTLSKNIAKLEEILEDELGAVVNSLFEEE